MGVIIRIKANLSSNELGLTSQKELSLAKNSKKFHDWGNGGGPFVIEEKKCKNTEIPLEQTYFFNYFLGGGSGACFKKCDILAFS